MRPARRRQSQGRRAGRNCLSVAAWTRTALNSAKPRLPVERLSRKQQRKRCVPKIRRRQVCQGSWKSGTFSYNVGEPWVEISSRALETRVEGDTPLLICTDWLVVNSKNSGPVALKRGSAIHVETEIRSAGERNFGSGSCLFIAPVWGKLDGLRTFVPERVRPSAVS